MTKVIPVPVLQDVASILNFIRKFPIVKKVEILNWNPRQFILKLTLPWYVIWPFSFYIKKNIQKQMKYLQGPEITIKIKH